MFQVDSQTKKEYLARFPPKLQLENVKDRAPENIDDKKIAFDGNKSQRDHVESIESRMIKTFFAISQSQISSQNASKCASHRSTSLQKLRNSVKKLSTKLDQI